MNYKTFTEGLWNNPTAIASFQKAWKKTFSKQLEVDELHSQHSMLFQDTIKPRGDELCNEIPQELKGYLFPDDHEHPLLGDIISDLLHYNDQEGRYVLDYTTDDLGIVLIAPFRKALRDWILSRKYQKNRRALTFIGYEALRYFALSLTQLSNNFDMEHYCKCLDRAVDHGDRPTSSDKKSKKSVPLDSEWIKALSTMCESIEAEKANTFYVQRFDVAMLSKQLHLHQKIKELPLHITLDRLQRALLKLSDKGLDQDLQDSISTIKELYNTSEDEFTYARQGIYGKPPFFENSRFQYWGKSLARWVEQILRQNDPEDLRKQLLLSLCPLAPPDNQLRNKYASYEVVYAIFFTVFEQLDLDSRYTIYWSWVRNLPRYSDFFLKKDIVDFLKEQYDYTVWPTSNEELS